MNRPWHAGRAGLLSMTLCALALLPARAAHAQLAVNGKTLTVTTTNAVATFNGADLVGFTNTLTTETYLKKPSNGDLVQVDAIASTGQALQTSNWSMGTEPGTGVPLATITAQDSARTFTMTVKIDPASQEIVLRSSASVTSGGVRGASWRIAGLDLAAGKWIVPANSGAVFDAGTPGVGAFIAYPNSWQAQMAVYQGAAGSLLLYSTDTQIYFKDLRQTTRGDSMLDVAVYTEATAPWPSATAVPSVEWRLKAFAGDWRAAATPYRDWMLANRPPVSNAAHPWVSNIRNVVAVGALDSTFLAPLAAQLNPAQTLLYLVNWRQSNYDVNYPDYTPTAGATDFVTAAHALGFKVMLHTDILGVAPTNADYASVQQYQARTSGTLQLMGWNWDQPSNQQRYGLIDPAASAYRALWIARIGVAINLLKPDALHLDFTAMYNDGNGPIEGRTFPQGEDYFNQQIITAFPNIALGSEEEFDFTYRYHSFAQMGFWAFQSAGHPITNFLFSPQVEYYGHLGNPQVTDPAFKSALMRQMQIGAFPLWWIYSPSSIDTTDPDIARFIQMAKAWQSNAFQPAWTTDWTGALIRYQGVSGASAALTDSGGLFSLESSQSTLFTLAHDASQVSSVRFIDGWAAFDNSTLYGLDPSVLYFLDPEPRPDSTHATSLPPGIRLGTGTLVTPSFARLELAPPAPFDFTNLSKARAGITYQGVDYPLGFGALVQSQTNTAGGVSRSDISIQPPWQGQTGGETFAEYSVPVPAGAALRLSVGIDDGATCTDGVTFRVTAGGTELWHQNFNRGAWHDVVLSLAAYAGSTVPIRLISNPGPAANPSCDWAGWSDVALVAPTPAISVPIKLAGASIFSGIDGAAYTSISGSTGTVTNAAVPGAFTIFTQPGSAVVGGTNLATLPFDVWHWDKDGSPPKTGSVFNAGMVQSETSGGVTKNPAIWAHPPNASRTVLSWALRLPANSLQLGWNAGLIDGANSDDGVTFEVRVNGLPYWTLTTGVQGDDHWTAGQLDLSRWQGQSIWVELITDSRSNFNSDWAAWADLVLGTSAGGCSYSVPSSASAGAIGGTFTANVTTSSPCSWSAVPSVPWITITAGSGAGNGSVAYSVAPNSGGARTGTLTIAGQTLTVTQDSSPTATMMLDRSSLIFAAVNNGAAFTAVTAAQTVRMTQTGSPAIPWSIGPLPPWLHVSPTSGSGSATLTVTAQFVAGLAATQVGAITINLTGAGNSAGPINVRLNSISPASVAAPFGSFDTPANGATGLAGSVPVTGWALDDVGVTRVTICRGAMSGETLGADARCNNNASQAYIGDAIFIDGARPDVQGAFPTAPQNTRAGWGYLMLTNFLPDHGNGTFTFTAYAFDADGHVVSLPSAGANTVTVTCNNNASVNPFGSIDTPAQGEVISGSYGSFGWVLSPGKAKADGTDGGTVTAFVDGTSIGAPGGWAARSDLTSLFLAADFSGVNKALAIIGINSTAFSNGLHTYAWNVTDTAGHSGGIGSRFIGISNGSLTLDPNAVQEPNVIQATNIMDFPRAAALRIGSSTSSLLAEIDRAPADLSAVQGRRGFDLDRALQAYPSETGRTDVQAEELDRVELQLSATADNRYSGYLRTVAGLMPLPIGSHLDASTGAFTWMPGVGFYGVYDLVFVRWSGGLAAARQDVRITLNAKGSNRVGPQTIIDAPSSGDAVRSTFFLGGWAADLDAVADTGVVIVHVWAYPVDATGNRLDPIFVGPAIYGGARPDVAAVYGDRFLNSGYGMIVQGLAPGTYDVAVFGLSTVVGNFTPAKVVRVVIR